MNILKDTKLGRSRRRLYKPERAPARKRGVLNDQAPVGCPSANTYELRMALVSICRTLQDAQGNPARVDIGRGAEYNPLRDEYTVVGKSRMTGKVQDFTIEGAAVAVLVKTLRAVNGVRSFDKQAMVKAFGSVPLR